MNIPRVWCIIFVVIAACTCGARTECSEIAQISFLTSIHDDTSCMKLSTKGVMLYEAAKLLTEIHNNKTNGFKIGITVLDTCDSITGALKAMMKALVWADISCLHPPHYLGIIGPDTITNAEAVHKVTSILQVPHIVKKSVKKSVSPYLHPLAEESNSYIVQGILRMIETLKWKSFTLIANADNENDDGIQNIAKKLTINAIAKNVCVIIHNSDEEDYSSHIVHIGKPKEKFFNKSRNAIVLIISEGNLKDYLNQITSTNTILLLEDSRNIIDSLEKRVENSQWWTPGSGLKKYDAAESKQIRWLESAIEVYVKALKTLCANNKCKNQISPLDWNHVVSNILIMHNVESQAALRILDLSVKMKTGDLKRLGSVIARKNKTKIYWGESKLDKESDVKGTEEKKKESREESDEDIPYAFRKLLNRENVPQTGCATSVKEIRTLQATDSDGTQILVSGMDDNEWWTMVCMVSGIGIAMFLVGILAVYVIYANVRPRYLKNKDRSDRDASLRRMSSDRELPTTITTRNQRTLRAPQRTGSDRSTVSEKSV